jgi:hypothetical protein
MSKTPTLATRHHWTKKHNVTKQAFAAKMKAQGVTPAQMVGQTALWNIADVEAALKRAPFVKNPGGRKKKADAPGSGKRPPRRP